MTRKETIAFVLKVVLFAPFFMGTASFLIQTIITSRLLSNKNHYEAKCFVKNGEFGVTEARCICENYVYGRIDNNEVTVPIDRLDKIKKSQVGDTIYIWYIKGKNGIPRPYDEKEFRVWDYAYSNNRLLMILGIPPFLILLIIERIMKRKKRNLEQKTRFRKR